jgi:hypothetical protein
MSEALGTMTDYLKLVQDAGYKITDFADTQKAAMIISESFTGKLEEQARAHDRLLVASELGKGQMADYAAMQQQAVAAIDQVTVATARERAALDQAQQSGAERRAAIQAVTQRYQAQADAQGIAASSALEEARAQEKATEARNLAAASAGELAENLKDATDQQIASALIDMLDPEKMGAEAYSTAVTEIGTSLGLMDEESIALSENLPALAEAIEGNVIPMESADEALGYLIEDARDGYVAFDDLIDKVGPTETVMRNLAHPTNLTADAMGRVASDAPSAAGGISDVGGAAEDATGATDGWASALGRSEEKLRNLVAGSPYTITVNADGGGGGDDDDGNIPEGTQSGTMYARPGSYLVGERGPELVTLPRGARVYAASSPETREVRNSYAGDTYHYHFHSELAWAMERDTKRRRARERAESRM